ncbi:DUF1365 domain-containing protein [Marinobacter mobilis]|uniref:DUF1365 domain-containing protein n=1 Tax=Marinobacter mobilis TaxID=488533 RepID=A0A1H2V9I0_9GAMM|nr:DUF1365 domain-containing protein [Marinobacter mobilis]SDW64967.1 hypothetical protein SAMN04487960_103379 [Marinobacter mobilis]
MRPSPAPFSSQFLTGTIRHRRFTPVEHQFCYQTGLLAIDLDEWSFIDRVSTWLSRERFNWTSLHRSDYFQPGKTSLKAAVTDWVEETTGWRPDGRIELVTHPRYLGHAFNPVSFYFCFPRDADLSNGSVPRVILAEITNTPWHEKHLYCLEADRADTAGDCWQTLRFRFPKAFHVSPFNSMDQDYQWLFAFKAGQLLVHMNVYEGQTRVFDSTLNVDRTTLSANTYRTFLHRFPVESLRVVAGIYWQALRLKLKGARFHSHPGKECPATSTDNRRSKSTRITRFQSDGSVTSWNL